MPRSAVLLIGMFMILAGCSGDEDPIAGGARGSGSSSQSGDVPPCDREAVIREYRTQSEDAFNAARDLRRIVQRLDEDPSAGGRRLGRMLDQLDEIESSLQHAVLEKACEAAG